MNSLKGVIPGALLVALVETAVLVYIDPILADSVPMLLILLVLMVRPWGIFGRAEEIERV
jgi:branched-chain amino acid transport system permease protein